MKKRLAAPLLAVFVLIAIAGSGIGKATVRTDPVYLWGPSVGNVWGGSIDSYDWNNKSGPKKPEPQSWIYMMPKGR